jgi:hypothetical protein
MEGEKLRNKKQRVWIVVFPYLIYNFKTPIERVSLPVILAAW